MSATNLGQNEWSRETSEPCCKKVYDIIWARFIIRVRLYFFRLASFFFTANSEVRYGEDVNRQLPLADAAMRAGQETLRNILHLAAFFSIQCCIVDASAHIRCGRAGGTNVLWRMWSRYSPLSFLNASQKLEADLTMAGRLDASEDRAQRRS